MIRRLYIDGYKSLREVQIEGLSPLTVFFGANAAGKSNLLDALDLLAHLAREDALLQAFQRHRGSRASRPLPVRQFFTIGRASDPVITFEIDVELRPATVRRLNDELGEREAREDLQRSYTRVNQDYLRYRVQIAYDRNSRSLTVTDEQLVPLTKDGQPHGSIIPYIKPSRNGSALSVKLERQAHPRTFPLPRARTLLSEINDIVNHPHIVALSRELSSMRIYYIEPTRMRSEVNDIEAREPGSNGECLASFYHWLQRRAPVRFKNLEYNLGRLIPGFQAIEIREAADGFLELVVHEEGRGPIPAALLSEGTLRLLCLLGILATPDPPFLVGYEEPENGVHPGRLHEMLEMLQERGRQNSTQFLLTTHSPMVLDDLEEFARINCSRSRDRSVLRPEDELPLFKMIERSSALGERSSLGARVVRGDLD